LLIRGGEKLFADGLKAFAGGDTYAALSFFERAIEMDNRPAYSSYLAVCVAKERRHFELAFTLCERARMREPQNPVHYLNLGKIYLLVGKKADAITTFKKGFDLGENTEITEELNKLGIRKTPVIPSLDRSNPVNKWLGIFLKRTGWR
jgi:tetratricopeptide (TPR) repeat protein